MIKASIRFEDLVEYLNKTEYGYHFEAVGTKNEYKHNIRLVLFVDGNPSSVELLISQDHVEVTKEIEL